MKTKTLLGFLLTAILLGACNLEENNCLLPPEGFSKADLVGTWMATRLPSTDTLLIQEDGTYKQIIHIENPDIDYESDWQVWRLEYGDDGLPYLHMEGFSLCAYNPDINCEQAGSEFYWYDFCQDATLKSSGEGVLVVLGTMPTYYAEAPSGIRLALLLLFGSESAWSYERQEPQIRYPILTP